jgi:hypothetical protein
MSSKIVKVDDNLPIFLQTFVDIRLVSFNMDNREKQFPETEDQVMDMWRVPVGKKFKWRPTPVSPWQEYTAIKTPPDQPEDECWARCAHGREDRFNPYATVELVD